MPSLPRAILLGSLGLLAAARLAAAEPMRLGDPRPRWVSVRFETSPEDEPGRLDGRYGEAILAWLAPDRAAGRVLVTVPARWVESRLLATQGARPGTFSDFTWVFDARTGDVISASLSGRLLRQLGLGPFGFDTEVDIQTELTTLVPAGYRPPERLLGQRVFVYCDPRAEAACTPVRPVPYDPRTGYVNAVGFVKGRTARVTTLSFSPLGEARFSELEAPAPRIAEWPDATPPPSVSAPPPDAATAAVPSPPSP